MFTLNSEHFFFGGTKSAIHTEESDADHVLLRVSIFFGDLAFRITNEMHSQSCAKMFACVCALMTFVMLSTSFLILTRQPHNNNNKNNNVIE